MHRDRFWLTGAQLARINSICLLVPPSNGISGTELVQFIEIPRQNL
jgi:hypothetical protein